MPKHVMIILRLGIGGIFTFAGVAKAISFSSFQSALAGFDLIPPSIAPSLALVLTGAETLLGIALILGFQTRRAAILAGVLSAGFVIVIGITLVRGNEVECGCFGEFLNERVSFWLLLRDALVSLVSFSLSKGQTIEFSIDKRLGRTVGK